LVSTGIGATAGLAANYNIVLGTCVCASPGISCSIILSTRPGGMLLNNNNSFLVSVGDNAGMGNGSGNIVIGTANNTFSNGSNSVNIGGSNYNQGGTNHVGIGADNGIQGGNRTVLIGKANTHSGACDDYVGIGTCNSIKESQVYVIGSYNTAHPGTIASSVVGVCNIGGTAACDAIILGRNNTLTVPCAIAIGTNLTTCNCCINNNAVLIGKNICVGENTGGIIFIGCHGCLTTFTGCDSIAIGKICSSQNPHCSVMIGNGITNAAQLSVYIGQGGQIQDGCKIVTIGTTNNFGVARETIVIGDANCFTGGFPGNCRMVAIGGVNCMQEYCTQAYGYNNLLACGATGAASLGHCNTNCFTGAIVVGNSLTSEKINTTHVNHLIAFGQGASKYHAVGNITGTTSLDWDNGNNQSVTLTGSVILGFSNPIAGGNYGISITQGGVGGYTIAWAGVLWANATPPVLSAAVASVDFVNLVYDGTNYYGTFGNNFA
jgi:hypothetical protein